VNNRTSVAVLVGVIVAALSAAPVASARHGNHATRHERRAARHEHRASADRGVVFVQTNEPSGNRILVFERSGDGNLTRVADYSTGGRGGVAAPGTESDHLGSQGSLAYDPQRGVLIAVNAGSNTVSSFSVTGHRLRLESVVPAGGLFPASVTIHDGLVYVLDSGGHGTVQGYRLDGAVLHPIHDSARSLGLDNTNPPFFLNSPGQVGFTPNGGQLIVTTKGSGSNIDVFAVGPDGRLSGTPVRNASATPVPFAFTFTPNGRLAAGEAGTSNVSTYRVQSDGTLAEAKSQTDGQTALCWIVRVERYYYVSNTGSNDLSGYTISASGQPSLITPTGVVASTEPGPIDLASPADTRFLYALTGGGTLEEFRVNDSGTLTKFASITGLPAGQQGITGS
jgi:hypothetical protein